jgi:hypothetical protein
VSEVDCRLSAVSELIREIGMANSDKEVAAVLIGSVARHTATPNSDIDLLVVGADRSVEIPAAPSFHVQFCTIEEFRRRLAVGDDFAAWCVRYGVVLLGEVLWLQIIHLPESEIWPIWNTKVVHAFRRLIFSWELIATADLSASQEELMYAFAHVARAILLRRHVFPLSRPELPDQLVAVGENRIGACLQNLCGDELGGSTLRRYIAYAKKLLVGLDQTLYETCSHEYQLKKRARIAKRASGQFRHP